MNKQNETVKQYRLSDFKTSEIHRARTAVAQKHRELARAIRQEDHYASHVTENEKDEILKRDMRKADEIEAGEHDCKLWCLQSLLYELTGKTFAILP